MSITWSVTLFKGESNRLSKAELEEMGEETDNLVESTSKLRAQIKALSGVDIMLDENTFKSTAQIIKEIGAVYDNLSDISRANILETLAGVLKMPVKYGNIFYRTHLIARTT